MTAAGAGEDGQLRLCEILDLHADIWGTEIRQLIYQVFYQTTQEEAAESACTFVNHACRMDHFGPREGFVLVQTARLAIACR